MASDTLLVMCTCPNEASAEALATALIDLRLAACVSQMPGLKSWYRWRHRVECDDEVLLLMKTHADRYAELVERLQELHPYEVPEVLAFAADRGLEAYLSWVHAETRPPQEDDPAGN